MQCSNHAQLGNIALVLMLMLTMTGFALHTETSKTGENGREKPRSSKKNIKKEDLIKATSTFGNIHEKYVWIIVIISNKKNRHTKIL